MGDPRHWLNGRVAVVTGASRGIGAATAMALAGAGAQVILAARDDRALGREWPTGSGTTAERRGPYRPT